VDDRSVTAGRWRATPVSWEVARSSDRCRDLDPASLRCEDSRSNSEPRDELFLSETRGAEACGVGAGVLSAPSRLPMRLVSVRSGASSCCGGAYIRAVSIFGLDAILSVACGVRSGCTGRLSIRSNIDPRLGAFETEGALTAGDLLSARELNDGRDDRDEFGEGADGRELNEGWNDRDEFGEGADGRELNEGWNDRDEFGEGADGRELNEGRNDRDEFDEGAEGRELNDPLRLDIRLVIEFPPPPRFVNDRDGAICDRFGADALGADRDTWLEPPLRPPAILP
jgi:hypothetical protein